MNGNVNGMTIRLLGCALAMLVLAAMSVTTGSFAKAADARDAAQENHVAAEDVVWDRDIADAFAVAQTTFSARSAYGPAEGTLEATKFS